MEINICAVDGFNIRGTLFKGGKISCLISAATGVRASFYANYAKFLALNGCTVLTYDYRGIGKSVPCSLESKIYPHWVYDELAAVKYLEQFKNPIVIIGHSVGGHLIPFTKPTRALLISVNSAYFEKLKPSRASAFVFQNLAPKIGQLMGVFPSKMMGMGDNIPLHAGLQWSEWSKQRRYFLVEKAFRESYSKFEVPCLAVSFDDDHLAKKEAFGDFLSFLPNCPRHWFHSIKKAGHHGFFKDPILWEKSLDWILEGKPKFGTESSLFMKPGEGGFEWIDKINKSKIYLATSNSSIRINGQMFLILTSTKSPKFKLLFFNVP